MNLIQFAINNPVKVLVGIFFIVVFGLNSLFNMPYQLIPNIEYPQITVRTSWTGASPYEMEKEVVDRQERVLKTIPGLIDFESNSSTGSANVTLMFGLDVNINDAILLVSNKLNEVRGYPDNVDRPTIRSSNTDQISVVDLMLITDPENKTSIDEYASYFEEIVKPYIERVNGVADLSYWGGNAKQIHIQIDPNLLSVYNITIPDIVNSLTAESIDISAGTLDFGAKDYRFRTMGEAKKPEDIREIVVRSTDNSRVKLGDIAIIDYGYAKKTTLVRYGKSDGISVGVIAQSGTNILKLTDALEKVITDLNNGILKDNGLKFVWISDQRSYITNAISLVKSNIIVGGILAVLVLLVFLRSVRSTLVIAVTIPICVIGTFFVMSVMGRTLNVISLAGIAFSVGMLIDTSIVVLENIDRHMSMGKSSAKAALEGTQEVWGAILASALTTIAVFLPVVFIKEEAGQLFGDIAIAVSSAVGLSLVASVLVIPVFTKLLYEKYPKKEAHNKFNDYLVKVGDFFVNIIMYLSEKINSKVSLRLFTIFGLTAVSVLSAYLLMPKMDYLPLGNRNMVQSVLQTVPGLSYEERKKIGEFIYNELEPHIGKEKDGFPAIEDFVYLGSSNFVRLTITSSDENRAAELQPLINKVVSKVPGTTSSTSQSPLFNIGRGSGNTLMMNVGGAMDYDELTQKVGLMRQKIKEILPEAQIRVMPSDTPVFPEIQVYPDRQALNSAGVSANELGVALNVFVDGRKIGEFKDPSVGTIDIMLRADDSGKFNPDDVYSIIVNAKNGRAVPIYNLAETKEVMGVDRIRRYNSQRSFMLNISIQSGMVLEELKETVMNKAVTPLREAGLIDKITITTSGASSKLDDAKNALIGNFLFATLITYLLMAALFDNFLFPFIILFSVPLAASGGFLGLAAVNSFLVSQPLDILTMLGFIMLIGTVVNNPILIVCQAINNVKYGMGSKKAISESLRTRIRPISMSTMTSLFGMLPLVLSPGPGSELYRGLGSVILGGMALSTIFTMFMIPALLSFFLRSKNSDEAN